MQQATRIAHATDGIRIVATSNVTRSCGGFDFRLDFEKLIDRDAVFMDNSFIMLLKVLVRAGVRHVALAALDGYSSDRATDYYSSELEYESARRKGSEINAYVNRMLPQFRERVPVDFITTTVYDK